MYIHISRSGVFVCPSLIDLESWIVNSTYPRKSHGRCHTKGVKQLYAGLSLIIFLSKINAASIIERREGEYFFF